MNPVKRLLWPLFIKTRLPQIQYVYMGSARFRVVYRELWGEQEIICMRLMRHAKLRYCVEHTVFSVN